MKVTEQVHLIRKEFYVTPTVKRYVNIYLIVGRYCYLIDCGVVGSEVLIEEYLNSLNRKMTDINGLFLTHSHPDHIGAAAEIKKRTGCQIYAPIQEVAWIEDIQKQFQKRPIPNFFQLLSESVKVDKPLTDGEELGLEEGLKLCSLSTPGHSHGSMSFILNNKVMFTGDAIPVADDLPIFVDYEKLIESLLKIQQKSGIQYYCSAWDMVYSKEELVRVIENSINILKNLKTTISNIDSESIIMSDDAKLTEILKRTNLIKYKGNPLVIKSVEACQRICKK